MWYVFDKPHFGACFHAQKNPGPDNVSTGQLATPGPGAYMVASTAPAQEESGASVIIYIIIITYIIIIYNNNNNHNNNNIYIYIVIIVFSSPLGAS